jgi:peptide/nickel transport system ATP-binding protein
MNVLDIRDLSIRYATPEGKVHAVRELSLRIAAGECLAIVGESGAGKSQAMLAVTGLLPPNAVVTGQALFGGEPLLGIGTRELDRIRGARIGMVFQDPLTSLTPHLTVADQIAEPLVRHRGLGRAAARRRAVELLERVHVSDPARRASQYPHELSGGMRQRATIAMALACEPALLIADEPTTALDVTIQAQILRLLVELKSERAMALAIITHDLGVAAGIADRVAVMQAGRLVEEGDVRSVLKAPAHEHTRRLIASLAAGQAARDADVRASTSMDECRLSLARIVVDFGGRSGLTRSRAALRAVDEVSLDIAAGESIGIVGESGCGKSTLARAALRLVRASSGRVVWFGRDVVGAPRAELRAMRRGLQLVFQDPLASLDPRMSVHEAVTEPLLVHRPELTAGERRDLASRILRDVGLSAEFLQRLPHELSGGQCQRVGLARAMILEPGVLVCDEAVSALDASTQAQIVALIERLRNERGLSVLFISHNLEVVRRLCDRVLVLYLGRMMELSPVGAMYPAPLHPYTRGLLDAVPVPDPDVQPARLQRALGGELPSPLSPPPGCVFNTRCPRAEERCATQAPAWEHAGGGRHVACHFWREWAHPEIGTRRD